MKAPLPDNEAERLRALHGYGVLDTPPELAFDDLTLLAARICQTPTALVTLIDEHRQWFKSLRGFTTTETKRDLAFCAYSILQREVMVVPDATDDPRFMDNALVTGAPYIRFYAGAPLITAAGFALGSLAVIDYVPRQLSAEQIEELQALGRQAVAQLELRRKLRAQQEEGLIRVVSERKRAETERQQVFERITDAFVALDMNWRYTYLNAKAGQLFGRRPEDLVGKHIWTEFPEGLVQKFHLAYERAMTDQQPVFLEEYYPPYDRWFENSIYPSPEGLTIYFHDITERKKSETLLNGQKQVLELIAMGSPLAETLTALVRLIEAQSPEMLCTVLLLDADGVHMRHGAAPSLPADFARAVDGAAIGPTAGSCGTAAFRRETVIVEDIATDPLWAEWRALALPHGLRACWSTPIFDAARHVLGTFAIYYRQSGRPSAQHQRLIEIATHTAAIAIERHRSEAALRESEKRLRSILDTMFVFVGLVNLDGQIVEINNASLVAAGLNRAEVLGRTVWESYWFSYSPALQAQVQHALACAAQGEVAREDYSIRVAEGRLLTIDTTFAPLRDAAGRVTQIVCSAIDITDRKQAVEALRVSEERFRQMAENIDEVFWLTDPTKSQMLYISPGYERIWGRRCKDLYAFPKTWVEAILPEDRDRVQAAAMTRQVTGEYQEEYRIVRPDGSMRWIFDRAFPIKDVSGTVYRVVGVAQDITERKKLEGQFLRTQRLEAVGTLAGGVAHDLNNILSPVMMATSLLREKLKDPNDQKLMTMVETSAKRGAAIVRQLLTFSRGIEGARVSVQLRHLLKDMEHLMQETFPRGIKLDLVSPPDLWSVMADATQMHQVLMNLCVNARDAMLEGGRLTLKAENLNLTEDAPQPSFEARPGRYVVVTITDTGIGIPAELLNRIFEPFFTTKALGKGTGLGLSSVMGIVKSHGGFVTVESELGKGTTFRVFLPAAGQEASANSSEEAGVTPGGRGELILVVDDEQTIRDATRYNLEGQNYQVLQAADGKEAISFFLQYQDKVNLVLTDVMMPVMDGMALVRALRTIKPDLRIVATTGLDEEEQITELTALGVKHILNKPCTGSELLRIVRLALDA